MTKAELVALIADKTGVHKEDVLTIVERYFIEVKSSLTEGDPVWVRGFGSFIIKKRKAKTGRNIKKGEEVHIPEHFIPAFKPCKEFKDEVRNSEQKPREKKQRVV